MQQIIIWFQSLIKKRQKVFSTAWYMSRFANDENSMVDNGYARHQIH